VTNRDQTISLDPYEKLQERRRHIEFLLRVDFPGSNAPPPTPGLLASEASHETTRANYEAWQRRTYAQELRRAELSTMADEQLGVLVQQVLSREQERDRLLREKQTPPAHEPDWQFWTLEDEWMLHDAALLLVNLEPRMGLGLHLKKMLRDEYGESAYIREDQAPEGLSDEARAQLRKAQEIVRRAGVAHQKSTLAVEFSRSIDSEKWYGAVEPRPFLLWAGGKKYEVPNALRALTANADEQRHAGRSNEKATKESVKRRRNRNNERNRLIHELRAAGKTRKEIAKEVGGLSDSQIGRVLSRPKP
jgi:hypothetical protein